MWDLYDKEGGRERLNAAAQYLTLIVNGFQ